MTMYALVLVLMFAVPAGVLCAIYLSEYARPGRLLRTINLTIINLAGVPSIVYGLFGAAFFFDVIGTQKALWVASATLAMQALAIIITSSREALIAVPRGLREGSLAIGVSKLRTTFFIVLPQALPGIMTGALLAISRAAGETAPILVVGAIAASTVRWTRAPSSPNAPRCSPIELYFRITEGLGVAEERKWAIGLVLLTVVLVFNVSALLLRLQDPGDGLGEEELMQETQRTVRIDMPMARETDTPSHAAELGSSPPAHSRPARHSKTLRCAWSGSTSSTATLRP